ncbi:hypothetical protein [Nocardia sp. XZ_19_385]|uniref:hypothetical protein n=1 Tax=Nocardia sp. XZ_19_385 TaxID=2769488 RepID=UPI001890844E|nr:hypothetical protein [Nocardia sp. XZ_19_385]
MIRVNRSLVAGALLGGAVLMSVAPAQAHAPVEPQATETQAIGNSGIASGSADLNNFFCGTIWRPVCFPNGLPS